mmetsp:Transcript_7563/g.34262  ORF Transcript_7563/g.34262 Transcript_7563/m.34262 type:complete len:389 (-) Transcript_7563:3384-4550(-)
MPSSRKQGSRTVLGLGAGITVCLLFLRCLTPESAVGEQFLHDLETAEDACVVNAEKRIFSFVQRINHACDDSQRQRRCQELLSRHAIPKLLDAKLDKGCDAGCIFHTIVSEAGGKAVNKVAFSAFIRAFIVTQPKESKLYIWKLPWDEIDLPDITLGCSLPTMNLKLRDGSWQSRIRIQSFQRIDLGTSNLLKMLFYRVVGNRFRLLRSMVRLSDLLRFQLLQSYGGIYVDSDVLLLNDLTPLCNSTFTYRWSDKDAENSAVFGCPKNCLFVKEYIRIAGMAPLSYHPLKWRKVGRHGVSRWPVRLPTIVFDPVWLKHIGSDAYEPAEYIFTKHEDFVNAGVKHLQLDSRPRAFPASLGYHWHGGFASIPGDPDQESPFSQLHNLACL